MASEKVPEDIEQIWGYWFSTSAFNTDKRLRRFFKTLPTDPRCKFCSAPFEGIGGALVKSVFHKERSMLNPQMCNMCEETSRRFPGGAEVEMAILFADIRGSTALSEKMAPTEFSRLINRFYTRATKVITEEDGLVEKLAGDSVAAFWGAGFAGPDYVRRTVEVARKLARAMIEEGIPVGISVHYGVAYFGAVGASGGLVDITAVGDEVNTAARLASQAAAGEIIVSEQALQAAGIESGDLEPRSLELKGLSLPVQVRVMHSP